MDIINKGAKKKRGKVQAIGKICPRATGTDESSTLVAAERMALVLNAKQILLCKISIYLKSVSICITIITLKDKNSWLGKWAKAFRLSHFFYHFILWLGSWWGLRLVRSGAQFSDKPKLCFWGNGSSFVATLHKASVSGGSNHMKAIKEQSADASLCPWQMWNNPHHHTARQPSHKVITQQAVCPQSPSVLLTNLNKSSNSSVSLNTELLL